MEEIKLGEYFRTENGKIHKWSKGRTYTGKNRITKHSPHLIDLIQEGDYVNGEKVTKIKEWKSSKDGYFRYAVTVYYHVIRADEIEDVVTHEQFNQNKYIVGED